MENRYQVYPRERIYLGIQIVLSILSYGAILSALSASNTLWRVLPIGLIVMLLNWFSAMFLAGYIKGNAVKVSLTQFKEVFDIVNEQASALRLTKPPAVYVLQEGGLINAFATRLARKYYVVLFAPVVAEAYKDGEDTLRFITGHELGHIKRNHLGF